QREKEDTDQIRGFVLVLPRLAAVIHAVPGGEDIGGGVLQYPEYFPEGHPGPRHAADGDAVDLLKMVQALGLHGILEGHHRADGHQFAAGGAGVVVVELIGGQAIDPLDLRNHLVGAVVDGKAVDLAAGEQARQVGGQLGHVDADLRGFLPVDENVGDGFVDLHVGVHKDELPALPGADQDLVRQFLENLRGRGAADDEFHRHPHAAGGQGWARHHGDLQAGDLAHLGNDVLVDDLHGAAAALAPGGEDEGAKGAVGGGGGGQSRAVELEIGDDVVAGLVDLVELGGEQFDVFPGHARVALGDHEGKPGILLGCQFTGRGDEQHETGCDHDQAEQE